jgi:predicted metalloendopeptidase
MTRTSLPKPVAWIVVLFLSLMPIAGVVAQTPQASPVASPAATPGAAHGIQIGDMDLTVDPGEDFYQFANGGWLERAKLPADKPAFGVSDEIDDQVQTELFSVMEGMDTDPASADGKARAIYDQYLDMETRDAQGVEPLRPILDQTSAIASVPDGMAFQAHADNYQLPGLFVVYPSPLPEDATINAGNIQGPILSLPSEDYYLDDSEEGQAIRDAWIDTTTQLLVILGYSEDEARSAAEAVMAFETKLVGIKTPDAELNSNPAAQNNPRTLAELDAMVPSMDWEALVKETHLPDTTDTLIVVDLPYMEKLQGLLDDADPDILRYLFDTQLIWTYAPYLTTETGALAFAFQGGVLYGVPERRPIDERALQAVKDWFPDTLGRAYVAEYFPPEAKAEIEALVDNLLAAFRIRIEQNPWMSEATKQRALEKLDLVAVKVGYPDEWETYDDVVVGDSLVATILSAYDVDNAEGLGRVGQPVDRTEWFMPPFEVNAYYNPSLNEIVFPAAILQPPFFDPNADLASNYGGIGMVIGHEITHGFDISGSQFDGYGNLSQWWTEEDYAAFQGLNEQVIAQYSGIEILPDLMVDGELTVTENVADLGGLQIAYDALMIALDADGQEHTPWFLTQQQRFFIAAARNWRQVATPQYYQAAVASDSHAPAPVRGVQPLRQMDQFYDAFDIGPGDAEYLPPDERILVW